MDEALPEWILNDRGKSQAREDGQLTKRVRHTNLRRKRPGRPDARVAVGNGIKKP